MPPLSILVKPASSACNLNCKYCFYRAEAEVRSEGFMGLMSLDTAKALIKKAYDFSEGSCSFLFQGGEPTLAGLDFFKEFVSLEKSLNKKGLKVFNAVQTNGMTLDGEWADFFKAEGFLVGLSLDGFSELHNLNRVDFQENGTFSHVLKSAELLKNSGVDFNILSVVTARTARSPEKLWSFYKKHGFSHIQLIPCIVGEGSESTSPFALSSKAYGEFFTKIFMLWYRDFLAGEYVSVRDFENIIAILLGKEPEICSMRGHCGIQFVTEGNGNVYPCDFYSTDEYLLGNVRENTFFEMGTSENARRFILPSLSTPEECKSCKWAFLCRNGCRRERSAFPCENAFKNIYCEGKRAFFEACYEYMVHVSRVLGGG